MMGSRAGRWPARKGGIVKRVSGRAVGARGATLLEVVVAVAILGVVAALAVPAMVPLTRSAELTAAAEEAAAFLETARRWSVRTGRCHRVREAGAGLVIEQRTSPDCVNLGLDGWQTRATLRPEPRVTLDLSGQSLTGETGFDDDNHRIVFRPTGRLRGNADLNTTDDGARVIVTVTGVNEARELRVSALGRICIEPTSNPPPAMAAPWTCP